MTLSEVHYYYCLKPYVIVDSELILQSMQHYLGDIRLDEFVFGFRECIGDARL